MSAIRPVTRRILALVQWMLISLVLISPTIAQDLIPWVPSVEVAQEMAARQNRLVLLHFWAPSCGPCLRLDETVFNDPVVAQQVARDYVPVKINADESPALTREYGIDRLPTDVVASPSGAVLFRGVSPLNASGFTENLRMIAARNSTSNVELAQADSGSYWNRPAAHSSTTAASPSTYSNEQSRYEISSAAPTPYFGQAGGEASTSRYGDQERQAANQYENSRQQNRPNTSEIRPSQSPSGPPLIGNHAAPVSGYTGPPVGPPPTNSWSPSNSTTPPHQLHTPGFGPSAQTTLHNPPMAGNAAPNQNTRPGTGPDISPGNPPLGLDGFCSVTLSEKSRWETGDTRWGAIHRGRTYLFLGPAEQQRFLAAPDRFAPMLSGQDPVSYIDGGQFVEGKRQHGVFYREQVYLFSSETTLNQFWQQPDRYASAVFQAMHQASVRQPTR